MTTTRPTTIEELASPRDVLVFARWCRTEADRFEANVLMAAVSWTEQQPPESLDDAATWVSPAGDTSLPSLDRVRRWSPSSASRSSPPRSS